MLTRIVNFLSALQPDQKRRAVRDAYRNALSGEAGRLVLVDILREAGLHTALSQPSRDARIDAYLEGRRALGITILRKAGFDPSRLPDALVMDRLEEMKDDDRNGSRNPAAVPDDRPRQNPYGAGAGSGLDIEFGD